MNPIITLGNRIRGADPRHHAIFRGIAWVSLFVILGKVAGAAREIAVAYRYGTGADLDAYLFVLGLAGLPMGIWASVATAVLVPLAARIRNEGTAELQCFRSQLLGLVMLSSCVLAVFCWLGVTLLLRSGWTGLEPHTLEIALRITPAMSLLLPLAGLGTLYSVWLLAAGRHVNTLLECVPALIIASAVLLFSGGEIWPLVWGTVLGSVIHLMLLLIPLRRHGELDKPAFSRTSRHWPWFWHGFGILLLGQALMSLTSVIDQFFAVHLGTGAIATLSYANRVLALIISLVTIVVARATLPIFSEAHSRDGEGIHGVATRWIQLLFVLGAAAMFIGYFAAPWMIKWIFERGAFMASDTAAATEVLRYGLTQLPFYFAGSVLASYAGSQRRFMLLFWSGVAGLTVKVISNLALIPHFGINGIALGWTAVYAVNALVLWIAFQRSAITAGRGT